MMLIRPYETVFVVWPLNLSMILFRFVVMLRFANAKINLGLHVTGKRHDGYHHIETIFYPIKLYDVVEIIPSESFGMHVVGDETLSSEGNLCAAAYHLLAERFTLPPCQIHLLKRIPVGAGLGGGSSDATAVLQSIDALFNLGLTEHELASFALQLGADCPFFLKNKAVYATGIGADFEHIELDLSGYYIIVVKPAVSISTKEAYLKTKAAPATVDLREAIRLPVGDWRENVVNDFETALFPDYPEIQNIKSLLYEQGAVYASLSGSGSAVYGIFEKPTRLEGLPETVRIFYPIDL